MTTPSPTTVTGMTAAKIVALFTQYANELIASAAIVDDHLILTKQDGTTLDAGDVRGETGGQGPTGPAGGVPVDLPDSDVDVNTLTTIGAYYIAIGSMNLPGTATDGTGILEVFKNVENELFQYYIDISGSIAMRTSTNSGTTWTAWSVDRRVVESSHYSRSFMLGGI